MVPNFIAKRTPLYQSFRGNGLEIGAFEHPADLPEVCDVTYCDVISKTEALKLFPEVNKEELHEVDVILDIDKCGLSFFEDNSQDFVIINHVLEHLFDPVFAIRECFRVLKKGGSLVASVPDKRFTFDRNRTVTTDVEIFERIKRIPKIPTPEDYEDLLRNVHPNLLNEPQHIRQKALEDFLVRREHLNIWTDNSFKSFFDVVCRKFRLTFILVEKVTSKDNKFEFFACWKKSTKLNFFFRMFLEALLSLVSIKNFSRRKR